MYHRNYNSAAQTEPLRIPAPYYNAIDPTAVFFEVERITATVDSLGHIEFFDQDKQSLGFVDVPAAESPDLYAHSGQYGEVHCRAESGRVIFDLPVYRWVDHYPHCDGESDRWSRYVVRWFRVEFDCRTRMISIVDR